MAMQDFSQSLPMLLYRALDAVMPAFRRIFTEFGLTEQQWRVLRVLWEEDDMSLGELARMTLIPAPSLVGVLDRLGAQGLVEKRRSSTDRRQVGIRLTRTGRRLEERAMPAVARVYAELEQSLDRATLNALRRALPRLVAAAAALPTLTEEEETPS